MKEQTTNYPELRTPVDRELFDGLIRGAVYMNNTPPGTPLAADDVMSQIDPSKRYGHPAPRNISAIQQRLDGVMESGLPEAKSFYDLPFIELLDLSMDRDEMVAKAAVMPIERLIDVNFPDGESDWKNAVANGSKLVLETIANIVLGDEDAPDTSGCTYQPVAQLTGSMARSLFSPDNISRAETQNVLDGALATFGDELSDFNRSVLASSTGIYDMDVKLLNGLDPEVLYQRLVDSGGVVTISETDGVRDVELLGEKEEKIKAQMRFVRLPQKSVLKIIIAPTQGPKFSIDIAKQAQSEVEIVDDFRTGPHQSSKRNNGIADIVARIDRQTDSVDVGISGNPTKIVDSFISMNLPSGIINAGYTSPEQAIAAYLGLVRIEEFNPTNWIFQDERVDTSNVQMLSEAALSQRLIQRVRGEPLNVDREIEIVRDGLVALCTDKKLTITLLQQSGLDFYFGSVKEFEVLLDMSDAEFRIKMSTESDFFQFCTNLFRLSHKYPSCDQTEHGSKQPTPAESYFHVREAIETSTRNILPVFKWDKETKNDHFVLRNPKYLQWILHCTDPYFGSDFHSDDERVGKFMEQARRGEMIIGMTHIAAIGRRDIERHAAFRADSGTTPESFKEFLLSARVPANLQRLYLENFRKDAMLFELMAMTNNSVLLDPYYSLRVQGLPLGVVRVIRLPNSTHTATTFSHPAFLSPQIALGTLQQTMDHSLKPFSTHSLIKELAAGT